MLTAQLATLRTRLDAVRDSLRLNEAMRTLLASGELAPLSYISAVARDAAFEVKYSALSNATWRTLDQSTAVTSVYAAYERFVYDILREWFNQLPSLYPVYGDLHENVRYAHRLGTAEMLQKLDMQRYQHISMADLLASLSTELANAVPYTMVADVFFIDEPNLRRQTLEGIFGRSGLNLVTSVWTWVNNHPLISRFINEVRGEGNTAEGELGTFIEYRNDAAHGEFNDILGLQALLDIVDFIDCLCESIAEHVRRVMVNRYAVIGRAVLLGTITEVFQQGAIGIATMHAHPLALNDELIVAAQSRCQICRVSNLQVDDVDVANVNAVQGQEIGLALTILSRENAILYRMLPA